jgi:hypothetical protein
MDSRAAFDHFTNEYAQALQALEAIEKQSSTLLLLGGSQDLRTFVDQFIEMATRAKNQAIEQNETNFADWFAELIRRAESIRSVTSR